MIRSLPVGLFFLLLVGCNQSTKTTPIPPPTTPNPVTEAVTPPIPPPPGMKFTTVNGDGSIPCHPGEMVDGAMAVITLTPTSEQGYETRLVTGASCNKNLLTDKKGALVLIDHIIPILGEKAGKPAEVKDKITPAVQILCSNLVGTNPCAAKKPAPPPPKEEKKAAEPPKVETPVTPTTPA